MDRQTANLGITARQRQIIDLVLKGLSNKDISRILGIKEGTVKWHLKGVYKYFGISSRTQLVLKYVGNQVKTSDIVSKIGE